MIYSDEQKIITAQRLKQLRNDAGLSHEKLAAALSKQGVKVSVQALKDYEVTDIAHSKMNSTKGMKIETFFGIAQFYNVSTDYLFGLSEVKSIDNNIKVACEVTGLSDKAISEIKNSIEFSHNQPNNKMVINQLIEEGGLDLMCACVIELYEAEKRLIELQNASKSYISRLHSDTELTDNKKDTEIRKAREDILYAERQKKFWVWDITETIFNMLKDNINLLFERETSGNN